MQRYVYRREEEEREEKEVDVEDVEINSILYFN